MSSFYRNGLTFVGGIGPSGPNGPRGASGPTGPSGMNGTDGYSGPSGPSGSSGPSGPSGNSGANGVFVLPSVIVNPVGGQMIYAVGSISDDITAIDTYGAMSSSDLGTTWVNFGNLPALLKPVCCACNSNYLLMGGTNSINLTTIIMQVGGDIYRPPHNDISFNGNIFPIIRGAGSILSYPTCTRIIWWPYYQKFLLVLRYTIEGNYRFQIWQLLNSSIGTLTTEYRAINSTNIYDTATLGSNSFDLIDINVNGPYASAIVYNNTTSESLMIYSTNGGTNWSSTAPDSLTSYMSILPYYGDSWLRCSAGQTAVSGSLTYPTGVNGAVAVSVTGTNFDTTLYPSSMGILGSSYQVRSPDAGFIYGAAFNGKVWCVILPATYETDHSLHNPQGLTIFTSYDLETAISGDVNNITFTDGEPPRTQQIYPSYSTNHSSGIKPRIVWTGQRFIVFGASSSTNPSAGILTSPNGFDWSSVTSPVTRRYIRDICFSSINYPILRGLEEYTRFMTSASITFYGKMSRGLSSYVKNIGTGSIDCSTYYALTGNTILLPTNSSPYGGASKDSVITTDENAEPGRENSLLIN